MYSLLLIIDEILLDLYCEALLIFSFYSFNGFIINYASDISRSFSYVLKHFIELSQFQFEQVFNRFHKTNYFEMKCVKKHAEPYCFLFASAKLSTRFNLFPPCLHNYLSSICGLMVFTLKSVSNRCPLHSLLKMIFLFFFSFVDFSIGLKFYAQF